MRLLLVALATALMAAACGHDTTPTALLDATAPTVTTPAPSPTPTTLTIAQAAEKYQQIVKPSNDILLGEWHFAIQAYDANPTDASRTVLNTAAKHLAVALRTMAQEFRSTPWPQDAQSAMADLIKANASYVVGANDLAAAKTDDAVQSALALFDDKAVAQSSELVRQVLGLPPAPTR